LIQLVGVNDVGGGARAVDHLHGSLAARRLVGADHRHQRHDARAAGQQQQRARLARTPGEPAADGAAHLELVTRPGGLAQIRGDLAVGQPLHRYFQAALRRGAGY
jgi:hypothetical protein